MEDEYSFYIFLFLPWKKMFSIKKSFVSHGRRAFFFILLSSAAAEDRLFSVLCSSEASESLPFS